MKNTIESVNQEVSNLGWKLITEEYKNLDTEMEFICPEGHKVYTTLKRFRARQEYGKATIVGEKTVGKG